MPVSENRVEDGRITGKEAFGSRHSGDLQTTLQSGHDLSGFEARSFSIVCITFLQLN